MSRTPSEANALLAWTRQRERMDALIRELRELHKPYTVCWVCYDDYMEDHDDSHEHYIVCAQCCANNGYHTQECADEHAGMTLAEHCPTVRILDRYDRSKQ